MISTRRTQNFMKWTLRISGRVIAGFSQKIPAIQAIVKWITGIAVGKPVMTIKKKLHDDFVSSFLRVKNFLVPAFVGITGERI